MAFRFKSAVFLAVLMILSAFPARAEKEEVFVSGQSSEALAMLEERFASLSGSLGKMSTPPKLSGTLSLPPRMDGHIGLPGSAGNLSHTQEGDKR